MKRNLRQEVVSPELRRKHAQRLNRQWNSIFVGTHDGFARVFGAKGRAPYAPVSTRAGPPAPPRRPHTTANATPSQTKGSAGRRVWQPPRQPPERPADKPAASPHFPVWTVPCTASTIAALMAN
jgi:hypothetical protein